MTGLVKPKRILDVVSDASSEVGVTLRVPVQCLRKAAIYATQDAQGHRVVKFVLV